jgi:hypothetical protein
MFNVTPQNKLILICDKAAYFTSLLEKLDSDPTDICHLVVCRPISNQLSAMGSVYAKTFM